MIINNIRFGKFFNWFVFLVFFSCGKPGFKVTGHIEDAPEKAVVTLHRLTEKKQVLIDSTILASGGFFELSGESASPGFYKLSYHNQYITLVVETGDDIEVVTSDEFFGRDYVVHGSAVSKAISELVSRQHETLEEITGLSMTYQDNLADRKIPVDELKARLDKQYDKIVQAHRKFSVSFIEENLGNFASLMALYQALGPKSNVFNISEDIRVFEKVDSALREKYPDSEAVKALNAHVVKTKRYLESSAYKEKHLEVGAVAPLIALPDVNGDTISLTALHGNYVLLHFWASWSKPCIAINSNLQQAYNKFHDKGFAIYQVSLDNSKDEWIKHIGNQQAGWEHVSDLQYYNSLVVPLYNLEGVPANFLLDTAGVIIARDVWGEPLEQILRKVL